jgi:hypothetical protein
MSGNIFVFIEKKRDSDEKSLNPSYDFRKATALRKLRL